eukprot:4058486-Prymnesium_polylepis.1
MKRDLRTPEPHLPRHTVACLRCVDGRRCNACFVWSVVMFARDEAQGRGALRRTCVDPTNVRLCVRGPSRVAGTKPKGASGASHSCINAQNQAHDQARTRRPPLRPASSAPALPPRGPTHAPKCHSQRTTPASRTNPLFRATFVFMHALPSRHSSRPDTSRITRPIIVGHANTPAQPSKLRRAEGVSLAWPRRCERKLPWVSPQPTVAVRAASGTSA